LSSGKADMIVIARKSDVHLSTELLRKLNMKICALKRRYLGPTCGKTFNWENSSTLGTKGAV